mgnify:CR=1 FL=1
MKESAQIALSFIKANSAIETSKSSREVGISYFPTFSGGTFTMTTATGFVNDARVMSKGQVTIPKNVRAALGIDAGDRVTFIVEGSNVRVVNSAVYALMQFQEQMGGEADKAGLLSEEDVAEWITSSRRRENS